LRSEAHGRAEGTGLGVEATTRQLSTRALIVSLLAVVYFSCGGPGRGGGNHLPGGALLVVMLIALAYNPVARLLRRRLFSPAEMAAVFNIVAVGILAQILTLYLIPQIVAPFYFASPENRWGSLLHPLYPAHLFVHDEAAVRWFYEGLSGVVVPWWPWVEPTIWWMALLLMFCTAALCLAAILRRRWTEEERFSFAIVQVPLEVIAPPLGQRCLNEFFRNPVLWVGVAVPVVLHTIRGLHVMFPTVPDIPVELPLGRVMTARPWADMRPFDVYYQASVIGFAYLLPAEISASFWAFWLFYKLECLIGSVLGVPMPAASGYAVRQFGQSQEIGASFALVGTLLWSGRGYFRALWKTVCGRPGGLGDADEPMPYRAAVAGLALATVGTVLWCELAGIAWWVALGAVLVFYVVLTVGSWAVCAGGLIFLQNSFSGLEVLRTLAGTRAMSPSSLAMLTTVQRIVCFDLRETLMPGLLNGWRLGDDSRASRRSSTVGMAVGVVVALVVSCLYTIWRSYDHGGLKLAAKGWSWVYVTSPQQPCQVALSLIENPEGPAWGQFPFVAGGALAVVAMMWLRVRASWWPVHPVGFLVAGSWAMYTLWFSFLVGWLCKVLTMHYGGPRLYRAIRPAFLGFILGETMMGVIWGVVEKITGVAYGVGIG